MNIYLFELKAYRKQTIIWTITLIAICSLFMSLFPAFEKDAVQFTKLLEGYPESVRIAIGLELDHFFTILGYYSYAFMYITLFGAIQAMILGTSIISKEVREKTADFLLTKPVTRTNIITAKMCAAFTMLCLTNIFFLISSSFVTNQVATHDFSFKVFFMITLTLFFIQTIFLAIGFFTSVLVTKVRSVITISLGIVLTFFLIGMLSSTSDDATKRFFSPFKYFDNQYIIQHSSYEIPYIIVSVGVIIVSIGVSYLLYTKRDIHSV
jgi:ABC-2 type transport system permease protein